MRSVPRLAAVLALAAPFVLVAPTLAGPIADAARDTEALLAQGKTDEAVAALDKARDALWRVLPLAVKKTMFVTEAPQGFGVYEPRKGTTFKSGEAMYVYGEVTGYGYGRDGAARIAFEVALSVTQANGAPAIAPQSGRLELASRAENKEYMLALVYEPKGLPPGDYVLQADLKDVNSTKTTSIKLAFRIA
jgi:hypothetical protein